MPNTPVELAAIGRFRLWTILYVVLIAYASTVIGPAGMNFVPASVADVGERFLAQATTWVDNGSDQRSDWMGNLLMMAVLGLLMAGAMRGAVVAWIACFVLILLLKFTQLWFPPRTVTLNYIVAQSVGAAVGVALFGPLYRRLRAIAGAYSVGALNSLRLVLQIYAAVLIVLILMPLDFALSPDDLAAQWNKLPQVAATVTGEGRSVLVRAVLVVASIVSLMPLGMLLAITTRGRIGIERSVPAATWIGLLAMIGVLVLSTLVISASPSLLAVIYRTLGIALGAWLMRFLARRDLSPIKRLLRAAVPFAALPYVIVVLAVNGLVSRHWNSPAAAWENVYVLGLLPLFDYYIVTKAEAAKNIVAHLAMYAPIGAMIWLRTEPRSRAMMAALLGGGLSLCVELGRYLRPGLEGDINAVALGAVAAWAATKMMPTAWWMLEGIGRPKPIVAETGGLGWRERAIANRAMEKSGVRPIGEIERY